MYRYVKSDVDLEEVSQVGLDEMWDNPTQRRQIVDTVVSNMDVRDVVSTLEESLEDDQYKLVMTTLAANAMER